MNHHVNQAFAGALAAVAPPASHIPEPWPPYEQFVGPLVSLDEHDYRRARLCVNALAGAPDVTLEAANFSNENRALRTGLQRQLARVSKIKAERDAARSVLRQIAEYTGEGPHTTPWQAIVRHMSQQARDALKAEVTP